MKMMSINSNKRKGRLNPNSHKLGKSKFYPSEKNMLCDGIYGNSKLMYTAASLVGCVVQIQVQNGAIFEGVLRTFSHQLDVVLEMAHRVHSKCSPSKGISPTVSNLIASYPFEGGIFDKLIFKLSDIILMVASTVDMDYAVKDSFTDTAISKFNGQVKERELEPWEDVASDSEGTSVGFGIEDDDGTNGWDANDMFRTNAEKYGVKSSYDNSLQDYTMPLTKKDTEEYKLQEAKAVKIAHEIETTNSYQSRIQLENGDEEDKFSAVIRTEDTVQSKYVLPQKRRSASALKRQHNPAPLSKVYSASPPSIPNQGGVQYVLEEPASLPIASTGCPNVPKTGVALKSPVGDIPLLVNESVKPTLECTPDIPPSKHVPPPYATQTLPPRIERRRENEKKFSKHKGRTDEIEEFKKFSSNFKLTEDKDFHEGSDPPVESKGVEALAGQMERAKMVENSDLEQDASATSHVVKFSTLNPNAKEFVFNPNAKAFTPRSMSVVTPPISVQPPPPLQEQQNHMMPPPSTQMLPPQALFTTMAAPQYHLMQATPVSVAITSPFAAATPVPQPPPRFRKAGQPLLAPPTPSQLTLQYSSTPPGVLHASATHAQQTLSGYPQMNFVVGPRVMSPQPMGVIPTSHSVSYCDTSHLPTHLIMSTHPGASTTTHTLHQAGGQHSSHHPPQCHTPVLHPSPSPVHQVPPPPHSQPPTPTTIMYPGGTHHHLHQAVTSHHSQPIMHHGAFPTGPPQPMVLMQQPGQPGHHSHLHMHPLHSHGAHPMLSQMMILPTSAAMTTANTPPYMQHP